MPARPVTEGGGLGGAQGRAGFHQMQLGGGGEGRRPGGGAQRVLGQSAATGAQFDQVEWRRRTHFVPGVNRPQAK